MTKQQQPEIGHNGNIYTVGLGLYLCILLESWLKPAHHWVQSLRTQMQKLTPGFVLQLCYFSVVLFTLLVFSSLVCKNQGNNSTMTVMRIQWVLIPQNKHWLNGNCCYHRKKKQSHSITKEINLQIFFQTTRLIHSFPFPHANSQTISISKKKCAISFSPEVFLLSWLLKGQIF